MTDKDADTRREVLRMAGSTALIAGLAGCLDSNSSSDSHGEGSNGNQQHDHYTTWLYNPESLDIDSISLNVIDMGSFTAVDNLKEGLRDNVSSTYDGAVEFDNIDTIIWYGGSEILAGVDGGGVIDRIAPEVSTHNGFDMYEKEHTNETLAGNENYLLRSRPSGLAPSSGAEYESRDEIELLIDTYQEEKEQLADIGGNIGSVVDTLEIDSIETVSIVDIEAQVDGVLGMSGVVSEGFIADITDEVAVVRWVFFFYEDHDEDIDTEEIEENIKDNSDSISVDVSQSDRLVTIDQTLELEDPATVLELLEEGPASDEDTGPPPAANFGIEETPDNDLELVVRNADRLDNVLLRGCDDEISLKDDGMTFELGSTHVIEHDTQYDGVAFQDLCADTELELVGVYGENTRVIQTFDYEGDI